MIDVVAKIHDKFSIEFKVGFKVEQGHKDNNFIINTWFFFPNSLDINNDTYSKTEFYRDTKSNIRLITPVYLLGEIAQGHAAPLSNLNNAFQALLTGERSKSSIREYEYHIKMFSAIFKSALRDEVDRIISLPQTEAGDACRSIGYNLRVILAGYRNLLKPLEAANVSAEIINYFQFGDQFIGNVLNQHLFRLLEYIDAEPKLIRFRNEVVGLLKDERKYKRSKGYMTVSEIGSLNKGLIYRGSALKRYIESDLFLRVNKKRDGALVEQVYFSAAAGLSMIFATIISFSFQLKYGNFTMPLFVALVVSYMLKDRIKDLMRYFFVHRMKSKYFDNKTDVAIKEVPIGWIKEGADFITDDHAPEEVMKIRSRTPLVEAENRSSDEKILLYRKQVYIDGDKMKENSRYPVDGVNHIMRLNVNSFINKMDNPEVPLYMLDGDDNTLKVMSEKIYYINIVMQMKFEGRTDYKRFRIVLNRRGIMEIENL